MVDREPADAVFELVAVDGRAQIPARHVKLAIAAVAIVVVAIAGTNLLPSSGPVEGSAVADLPSPTPAATASEPPSSEIRPGKYSIERWQGSVDLIVPAGWSATDDGLSIYKTIWGSINGPSLGVYDVSRVVTDACLSMGTVEVPFVEVGPTVEDLTTALVNQVGLERSGPSDVALGGYPTKKFVITTPQGFGLSCEGGGGVIWENFGVTSGGTATIYVVDVEGVRLVIASHWAGPTWPSYKVDAAEDIAELDAVIASIKIEPAGVHPIGNRVPQSDLPVGRHSLTVEGVPFSFNVPTQGWEPFGSISLNKSITGPQGAEVIIYWTGFPDGILADRCASLLDLPVGASVNDLAAAVSTALGTELVSGPVDVTVGGLPAKHVVLTVRADVGCDPGFFYSWEAVLGGAFWLTTDVGDLIRVWIVEVEGTRLFIAAETHKDALPGAALTEADQARLEQEIQQIVDSIQLE